MYETRDRAGAVAPVRPLRASRISRWCHELSATEASPDETATNAERIDQIRALEELKSAAAAAQARLSVELLEATKAERAAAGVAAPKRAAGVAEQIALARRESPARGGRYLGLATALTEMPQTAAALSSGRINEWRATLLVRESACLSVADRQRYDAELGDIDVESLGDRRLVAQAKQIAYRLDAHSVVRRARRAEAERTVTIRPAPDTMTYVTALLPVAQGVAVYAALNAHAQTHRAQGDPRSRGQVMADTFTERLTGIATADGVAHQVHLVMTDRALLGGSDEPAQIPGYGTVPAQWAREQLQRTDSRKLWIRRLYTAPTTGQLVAMDSVARRAPKGLAHFIDIRDSACRTPWCDAPVRHRDHAVPVEDGGPTSAGNLQGLCERCNYVKQAPGWRSRALSTGDRHEVQLRTPTGHRYRSRAPAQPGPIDVWLDSPVERTMDITVVGALPRAG